MTHGGKLYRIGGFAAQNAQGEDHDLHPVDSVTRFVPGRRGWENLPPLPEPRSSHDSAVVEDSIYVVGGWALAGDDEDRWHSTAWKLDLTLEPLRWEAIADPPFLRRALAAAAHKGKLYVVGGMQKDGGPTAEVGVYDPAADSWSDGPALAASGDEDSMAGFGASATGGLLYVTTAGRELQRLADDGSQWEITGKTPTARFFHRLLPMDDHRLLVVGGANMETGKFTSIEVINIRPSMRRGRGLFQHKTEGSELPPGHENKRQKSGFRSLRDTPFRNGKHVAPPFAQGFSCFPGFKRQPPAY